MKMININNEYKAEGGIVTPHGQEAKLFLVKPYSDCKYRKKCHTAPTIIVNANLLKQKSAAGKKPIPESIFNYQINI